jgi:hypothetical protein
MAKIEKFPKKETTEAGYPLDYTRLQEGHFYECDNGTIVTVLAFRSFCATGDGQMVVNVATGVGGYGAHNHYKALGTGYICIDLNQYGSTEETHFFPM